MDLARPAVDALCQGWKTASKNVGF